MILNLDFNSDKSIYVQIKEEITKAIASGELKINESLPSVRSMAENIGVNLHTVNKSYNELKEEGFLNIDRRKGAIVAQLPMETENSTRQKNRIDLELLVAKSYLSGINKEEFLTLSKNLFDKYEVKYYE
ncbi:MULTISPECIES: GntR family transcriptional regulator [unclassified Clostridioides]|uniref:GntR family transcriptional regulator n=1 Tax=unclassified Clostridioides TaxID=2635829 RepID=UPI001D0C3A38|nr:GntR family transcriptional regulator [Clostridioides sp. ES-S-0001-02]MCC0640260.1 GntR family transcriptional regulator [Clostridioides sp. ES-S-0049-03]MCC0651960.1 GntR family transcriptional regulator [Clostridioides sp. ES-S-0001-03]MCC0657764.1 GntR family transcriptional regulator [Clostridioides sp. ES-S-0123-01]MCC0671234.1 GntR family transcriptional regulator [Clostridioides sp. ES-S-0145-01]MCC0677072.1 GntR family transcriptional regulator [Clostridioides sp. ES-W-0018-02]MCC